MDSKLELLRLAVESAKRCLARRSHSRSDRRLTQTETTISAKDNRRLPITKNTTVKVTLSTTMQVIHLALEGSPSSQHTLSGNSFELKDALAAKELQYAKACLEVESLRAEKLHSTLKRQDSCCTRCNTDSLGTQIDMEEKGIQVDLSASVCRSRSPSPHRPSSLTQMKTPLSNPFAHVSNDQDGSCDVEPVPAMGVIREQVTPVIPVRVATTSAATAQVVGPLVNSSEISGSVGLRHRVHGKSTEELERFRREGAALWNYVPKAESSHRPGTPQPIKTPLSHPFAHIPGFEGASCGTQPPPITGFARGQVGAVVPIMAKPTSKMDRTCVSSDATSGSEGLQKGVSGKSREELERFRREGAALWNYVPKAESSHRPGTPQPIKTPLSHPFAHIPGFEGAPCDPQPRPMMGFARGQVGPVVPIMATPTSKMDRTCVSSDATSGSEGLQKGVSGKSREELERFRREGAALWNYVPKAEFSHRPDTSQPIKTPLSHPFAHIPGKQDLRCDFPPPPMKGQDRRNY